MPDRIPYTSSPLASLGKSADEKERTAFYSSKRWRRLRADFLKSHPLCVTCLALGIVTSADTVHHLLERLDRPDLAYTLGNLEASCKACHTTRHKNKGRT
jgi:5-methylcytosine-specific restriction enzyme A